MLVIASPDEKSAVATDAFRRRDFINVAAASFTGVAVVPLFDQMNPSADILADAAIEIDLTPILPGQAIKALWRKQPLFVRNLTPQEVMASYAAPLKALRDPQTFAERTKEGKSNWPITLGVRTHLGCSMTPLAESAQGLRPRTSPSPNIISSPILESR